VPFLFCNMQPNRAIAPPIQPIPDVSFSPASFYQISPNICLYSTSNPKAGAAVRCELVLDAGNKYEQKNGLSYFTINNLAEGTASRSSAQIAEAIAKIGFFVEYSQGAERASISLNGLAKYLPQALEVVFDVLSAAVFPEAEFENQRNRYLQSLLVNEQKTAYLASVAFKKQLFGANHYLGRELNAQAVAQLKNSDLEQFFGQFVLGAPLKIFLAGNIGADLIKQIEVLTQKYFFEKKEQSAEFELIDFENNPSAQQSIALDGALQASLRIGRRMFDLSHPDYYPFLVCNTLLGGYFGSRLMKNIREEKGYTYGINSSLACMKGYGYWLIATDVKKENATNTLSEIHKEIEQLQTHTVGNEELSIVKNYLAGNFVASFHTVFDLNDKQKSMVLHDLGTGYYNQHIGNINAVQATDVKRVAQQYLQKNKLIEIVAGA
jgi:zinc protease